MVTDTTPRVTSNCNGTLKNFSFSFPCIVSSDLSVVLKNTTTNTVITLAETTDYTVADPDGVSGVLANYENGGTITTTATDAYAAGYQITIERAVPYTQAMDFTEGMPTLYETFEDGLDKATMQVQQIKDKQTRSIACPAEDSNTIDMELPNSVARAGKYLAFDSSGEPTAVALVTTDLAISGFMENFLVTDDATAARAVLDVDGAIEAALIDEDDFDSDSDTQAPTQQSAKAYINTRVNASIPAGTCVDWPTETEPAGWLERDGSSLLRADYPVLFAVIGTMFGAADTTHFNLPDDRGLFPRWWAHGTTIDPDKASRTDRGDGTGGNHVGTKQGSQYTAHGHTGNAHAHTASGSSTIANDITHYDGRHSIGRTNTGGKTGDAFPAITSSSSGANDVYEWTGTPEIEYSLSTVVTVNANTSTVQNSGGNETRPVNRYYMPVIKY